MKSFMEFKVVGLDLAIENFKNLKKRFPKAMNEAEADFMQRFLLKAKALCPVKTGDLKKSLHVTPKGNHLWVLSDGVSYGVFQEFGFAHKKSGYRIGAMENWRWVQHPFIMPAFYSTYPPVLRL